MFKILEQDFWEQRANSKLYNAYFRTCKSTLLFIALRILNSTMKPQCYSMQVLDYFKHMLQDS